MFQEIWSSSGTRLRSINLHVAHRAWTRFAPLSVPSLRLTLLIFRCADDAQLNPSLFPRFSIRKMNSHRADLWNVIHTCIWYMTHAGLLVHLYERLLHLFIQCAVSRRGWQDKGARDGKWWEGKKWNCTSREPLTWLRCSNGSMPCTDFGAERSRTLCSPIMCFACSPAWNSGNVTRKMVRDTSLMAWMHLYIKESQMLNSVIIQPPTAEGSSGFAGYHVE